ncbi:MAG: hypothetical protein ACKVP4_08755 [Hyphomicrobium sp.]
MRRLYILPCIAVITAAVITLGPGAIAQATTESGEDQQSSETTDAPAAVDTSMSPPPGIEKQLHTIPEDGETVGAFDFVPRWLRALLDSRPNEDLIVCIAGCSPNRDRVVYARLKEKPDPAPQAAVTPSPLAAPASTPVTAAPVAAPTKAADPAGWAPVVKAAAPEKPAEPDAGTSFVPTFNLPLESDDASLPK